MLTWSALRASAVACAMLQAEPRCLFPGPCTAVPGLRCSPFPGQKGFILASIFLPHLLWYQFEPSPSTWYQPGFAVPPCAPGPKGIVPRWGRKAASGLFSLEFL